MSEKKEESIADKKVSRRSMLKWTGALAAAAVVGGAVVYGATYKAPPPPPPSLKPPLSPEIATRVDEITKALIDRHAGETVTYGGCSCNCSGTGCLFKYHVKNGVLTSLEPDDTHHVNVGREDSVMTQQEFDWHLFQRRGCPIAYSYVDHENDPIRLAYPVQRAPGTARGAGQWVRIPYEQAISTISNNMKQMKDKYGPFFLLNAYGSSTAGADTVFGIFGAGCMGYGLCSDDVGRLNGPFSGLTWAAFGNAPSNDAADQLKYNKFAVYLGMNHLSTHWDGGAFSGPWYKRMSREKGTPIIAIDPKYTWDAEIWADQWIPIKPGTDTAFLMAIAYVILTEGLYDQAWVNKYMYGFQQQADYILGKGGKGVSDWDPGDLGRSARKFFTLDGWPNAPYVQYDTIPKTPEWAEKICGIPAATIRAIAEMYGKTKPAIIHRHAGATRKSYGEYTGKMTIFLNILTSNSPYVHGGSTGGSDTNSLRTAGVTIAALPMALPSAVTGAVIYNSPTFYRAFHWWKSVAYANNVRNGGPSIMWNNKPMTWQEWGTLVGYNASPAFYNMFNPKMLWGNASNCVVMGECTNQQIKVMTDPSIEFSFHQHTRITTTGKYCDMILPIVDYTFENNAWTAAGYGLIDSQLFLPQILKPPADAHTFDENDIRILEGIGGLDLARRYWSEYNGSATFDQDYEASKAKRWVSGGQAWLTSKGVVNPPTWDQLKVADKGHGLVQWHPAQFYPTIDTYCGQGGSFLPITIDTRTGLTEVYTDSLTGMFDKGKPTTTSTRNQEHFDFKGRKYAHMPNDWKDLQPIAVYHPCFKGMEDFPTGIKKTYPLMLITPKSRYAIHYLMGDPGNPRLNDVRRHSLIISPTDAKARGIKDNDGVRIWNEWGQVCVRAYVTNRQMPGMVALRTGYGPNYGASGQRLDINLGPEETRMGGATNQFTGADDISPITPAKVTSSVEVEKYINEEFF